MNGTSIALPRPACTPDLPRYLTSLTGGHFGLLPFGVQTHNFNGLMRKKLLIIVGMVVLIMCHDLPWSARSRMVDKILNGQTHNTY